MADGHFCDDKNRNLLRLLNNDGKVSDLILSGDASCPIFWPRKLQTEIALSTARQNALLCLLPCVKLIPLVTLLKEIHELFLLLSTPPTFHYKIGGQSVLHIYGNYTTKQIALKYHHFLQMGAEQN